MKTFAETTDGLAKALSSFYSPLAGFLALPLAVYFGVIGLDYDKLFWLGWILGGWLTLAFAYATFVAPSKFVNSALKPAYSKTFKVTLAAMAALCFGTVAFLWLADNKDMITVLSPIKRGIDFEDSKGKRIIETSYSVWGPDGNVLRYPSFDTSLILVCEFEKASRFKTVSIKDVTVSVLKYEPFSKPPLSAMHERMGSPAGFTSLYICYATIDKDEKEYAVRFKGAPNQHPLLKEVEPVGLAIVLDAKTNGIYTLEFSLVAEYGLTRKRYKVGSMALAKEAAQKNKEVLIGPRD